VNDREWWIGDNLEAGGRRLFQNRIPALVWRAWENSRGTSFRKTGILV